MIVTIDLARGRGLAWYKDKTVLSQGFLSLVKKTRHGWSDESKFTQHQWMNDEGSEPKKTNFMLEVEFGTSNPYTKLSRLFRRKKYL